MVHWRHRLPFVIVDIKFFAILYRLSGWITPTDHVNVPVFEIVVSGKGWPCLADGLEIFNLIGEKMKLKYICDWLCLMIYFHPWNDYDSVVRNVNCSSKLQRLVKFVHLLVIFVRRGQEAPLSFTLFGLFSFFYDLTQFHEHELPRCILEQTLLGLCMVRTLFDADRLNAVWHYFVVKLLWQLLHPDLVVAWQETNYLMEHVSLFRDFTAHLFSI